MGRLVEYREIVIIMIIDTSRFGADLAWRKSAHKISGVADEFVNYHRIGYSIRILIYLLLLILITFNTSVK